MGGNVSCSQHPFMTENGKAKPQGEPGLVEQAYHPSGWGGRGRRSKFKGSLDNLLRP